MPARVGLAPKSARFGPGFAWRPPPASIRAVPPVFGQRGRQVRSRLSRPDRSGPSEIAPLSGQPRNAEVIQQVRLLEDARTACRSIRVGDYLTAEGEKVHEQLFDAYEVDIIRR